MYPDLFLGDMSWKPLKISEKRVHRPAFSKYSFIPLRRGWQRVAQGEITNWHTFMVQIHLLCQQSDDYIQERPWFCISMYTVCYFHIIYLYKLTMNQTKYLVPLLLTFNKQEKSIYVPKSIGHFSPLMLPLAVCQPTPLSEWLLKYWWVVAVVVIVVVVVTDFVGVAFVIVVGVL